MKTAILMFGLILFAVFATAQTAPSPAPQEMSGPQYIIGSGAGFKPYQTTIKNGSSAFVEGGWQFASGLFAFSRVDMRPTDAQMVVEGCKRAFGSETNLLLFCGGPGFGVDAQSVGIAFTGGGKWFFSPKALQNLHAWIGVQVSVDKTTVPAPVSPDAIVTSPVQPSFRVGIYKVFP